jgi:hypothetical protein
MYGKLKRNNIKKRGSFWENALLLLIGVFAFVLARSLHDRGIQQKWATAILGTLIPFSFVVFAFRQKLLRWSLWASVAICLAIHMIAIWTCFHYILNNVESFPVLLWFPAMIVEVIVLLIVVKRIEERLSGRHERINLSF